MYIILNPKVLPTRRQILCAKFVRVIALFKARLHESYRLPLIEPIAQSMLVDFTSFMPRPTFSFISNMFDAREKVT